MKFILLYLGIVLSSFAALSQDLTPPQLLEFEVSPKTVNVNSSSQQIIVTMRITDNESGVSTPNITAGSDVNRASTGFGSVRLVSGSNLDGIWQATLTLPQGTTAGNWSVSLFPLEDNADNSNNSFGPGNQFDSSFNVVSESNDTTPPQLLEFEVSPKTVNVNSSSQQVIVTMRITDNESGVSTPNITAGSDVNRASTGFGSVRLVSGNNLDGIWQATLTVPQGTTEGNWSVSLFPLEDNADNSNNSFGPGSRFDSSFNVVSETNDTTPPQLLEFEVSPKTVNVNSSSQQVIVTMRITDNESGVSTPNITAGSDVNRASTGFGSVRLVSGSDLDGIWQATLTVPQGTTTGNWSVSLFPLEDNADNSNNSFGPESQFDSNFEVEATFYSNQLIVLPDSTDDEIKELGVMSLDANLSKVTFEVLDGKTLDTLRTIEWSDNYVDASLSLHVLDDMNDNDLSEIGLFGIQNSTNNAGKPQMFIRDLGTGGRVGVLNWPANWQEVNALVLPDMSGDGIQDVAIQGRFKEGNRPQLVVKNSMTNATVNIYSYPDLFVAPTFFAHSDVNGDSYAEISTFGRIARNNKLQVKIANGLNPGDKLKAYNFPDKWDNVSWHQLDDSNSDDVDDWGLFGINKSDGRPQLIVKDGTNSRGALRIHAWPADMQNSKFFIVPDMNNDGIDEVAAGGRRSNGRYQFQVQDGENRNNVLANHNINISLESLTFHVLPDLTGDEKSEIGFLGINAAGEYELVIREGDTGNGELSSHNLGSEWSVAPSITSLGDTNGNGLPDLLIYGQNISSEQLVIIQL